MKSTTRSFAFFILTMLGLSATFMILRIKSKHKITLNLTENKIEPKKKLENNIRILAESKLSNIALIRHTDSNPDEVKISIHSDALKIECKEYGPEIAMFSINEISSEINNSSERISCLAAYGFNLECVGRTTEDPKCKKDLTIARARIIADLTHHLATDKMSPEIAANRAVALIFSTETPQSNSEIYQLSGKILASFPDLEEAHNLRSFYGFQSIKDTWDDEKLVAVGSSAEILKASSDLTSHKKGLMVEYAIAILKYSKSMKKEDLEAAESVAHSYVSNFANEPIGYYMLMQTSGYQGDAKRALQYIEKGLSFGPTQQAYDQYVIVKKSLESGLVDVNILGLRVDFNSYFNVESLLDFNPS